MGYNDPPTAVAGFGLTDTDWNGKVRDSIIAVAKPDRTKVSRTAVLSIPNNAVTTVTWTQEDFDVGVGLWVPGAPTVFTVPAALNACYFELGFSGQFAINATGGRHASINRNGTSLAAFNAPGSAAWYAGWSITTQHFAFTGDTFSASVYQSSGAALNLDIVYPVAFWIRVVAYA